MHDDRYPGHSLAGLAALNVNGHVHYWARQDEGPTYTDTHSAPASATPLIDPDCDFLSDSTSDRPMSPYDKPDAARRRKCVFFTVVVALLIIASIVGIAVGVPLSRKNVNKGFATGSGSGSSGNGGSSKNPAASPGQDPSVFPKNPNLHQSFYGMAYTPDGSQLPNCGNSLDAVIQDIQLMSQLTKRVRLYGSDCNQSALVLEAIKQTKVDMQVYLGNYNVATDDDASYNRQKQQIQQVIQTYGTGNIAGVTVGNEYILNYILQNGGGPANGPVGDQGAALLVPNIEDTRTMLQDMNLNKNIPVGNADAGAYFNNKVLAAIDYGMANVHPWFGGVAIDDAAQWTLTFFQNQDVQPADQVPNKPVMSIAETGWPTNSSDPTTITDGPSAASVENLQTFLDTFICQANQAEVPYFYFELFDEKWKDVQFGGVEGWWGLFNSDRTLKAITIPNCQAP